MLHQRETSKTWRFRGFLFSVTRLGEALPDRFLTDRFQQGAVDGLGKAVFASCQHMRTGSRRRGKAAVARPFLRFL